MTPKSVYVEGRELRCGYTTGTCATAASKAAAEMLLNGNIISTVEVTVPSGDKFFLDVEDVTADVTSVRCAVRKDGGDDIDATHGILIYSAVNKISEGIAITGGKGVGTVTRKGLDQSVGNAAINKVPRQMIKEALTDVSKKCGYTGGLEARIDVPDGEDIATKTFNPNLGIIGGISILGTTGIVRPMSEKALVDAIRTEISMRIAEGARYLIFVPGNYGETYSESMDGIGINASVKCSNFIGEALDIAVELGAKGVLLIGNIGKVVKLSAGIMNTHSRNADGRMEIMAAYSIMAGCDAEVAKNILSSATTEAALDILDEDGHMEDVVKMLADKAEYHMGRRTYGRIKTGCMFFSSTRGKLCCSASASELMEELNKCML